MAKKKKPSERDRIEATQVELIRKEFGRELATDPPDWRGAKDPRPLNYLYRAGHLLVRDADVARVTALLRGSRLRARAVQPKSRGARRFPKVAGLTLLQVAGKLPPEGLLPAMAMLDRELGVGVATPDHLVSITPGGKCPATEPEFVPRVSLPDPGVSADPCDGRGVLVVVVDTGLLKDAPISHSWMTGVRGTYEPAVVRGLIPHYTGHGTFIAGVIRVMAPRAEVFVERVFDRVGASYEWNVVRALYRAMRRSPDIISLSAGTSSRLDQDLLGFKVFVEGALRHRKGLVLVAAAGNDSNRGPFFPAASPETVSVGALSARGLDRARFSNFGSWVDVYAPGEDLVNAYANGTYRYQEPPNLGRVTRFDGMARWSGTSFSTPLVAGLIAARMSGTGEDGPQAAETLLRHARSQSLPGVGAVLRPGQACRCRGGGEAACHGHSCSCRHDCAGAR